ncbi:hypothetical protein Psi02_79370 [Planotetraspora silvatica]|uniref:Calcium-binding protein n=1 Tax=Planotetraspora silvatica TaxID=234614 RepID=A0A8J3XWB1_9ACTN|nr:calcium-binding protein [Planotetraspora silvatica]GII51513.1 hypothetical protein Psi02_79370 [Planotetraspora silvatica]
MKRVPIRKSKVFTSLALTAVMFVALFSAPSLAFAADTPLPSPPLPAAVMDGRAPNGGVYDDDQLFYSFSTVGAISADGNTIAYSFISPAICTRCGTSSSLYVLNRKTGVRTPVTGWGPYDGVVGLSEDGSKLVYSMEECECWGGVWVQDLVTNTVTRVDQPTNSDYNPVGGASYDGVRTVVFQSMLPMIEGAGSYNWYIRDLQTGVTKLLKAPEAPAEQPWQTILNPVRSAVSPGGRFIRYTWQDVSLNEVTSVYDQVTGEYTRFTPSGTAGDISNAGKMPFLTTEQLVPQDTNGVSDLYLKDLVTGTVTLVSVDESGTATGAGSSRPEITRDSRYLTYVSTSGQTVFANLTTGARRALTGLDGTASSVSGSLLSRNGRYLLTNLRTESGRWGIGLRDQAQDCAGDFVTGSGSGTIFGSPVDDVLYGSPSPDVINGVGGNDVICGFGGDDVIDGGPGDDAVYGGDGNDQLEGNEGNDVVVGGLGSDTMNGGLGTDALLYTYATAGVNVDLNRLDDNGMPGEGDRVYNDFEQIYGSNLNDTISGRENGERLTGLGGDDLLLGQDGNDELWGGDGHDVLVGMAGNDFLNGGPGLNDSCAGGAGTNTFGDCKYTSNIP